MSITVFLLLIFLKHARYQRIHMKIHGYQMQKYISGFSKAYSIKHPLPNNVRQHFCNGMPSQAGSSPSRVSARPMAMHNFDHGNMRRAYQTGLYNMSKAYKFHTEIVL